MIFYLLYNAAILSAAPFYFFFSLFVPKLREFRAARTRPADAPEFEGAIWLHAASVGEMDQALAIAREIRRRSKSTIVLSVFSMSVKKLGHPDVDYMFRAPVDFPWAWGQWIRRLKPAVFVTMTWDVFPNLMRALASENVPAYLACAALASNSSRLKLPSRYLLRSVYSKLTGIGAVDEANAGRFRALTPFPERVRVTGDSRYDAIFHRIETAKLDPDAEKKLSFSGKTWILASTYAACDDQILPHLPALLEQSRDLRVLIFPHFVEEPRIVEIEQKLAKVSLQSARFSSSNAGSCRIMIVDRLGILALAYRLADFCYVGGGFHHRIHNTGEPAALGLPIVTGPKIETSPIALLLEEVGALFRAADGDSLFQRVHEWNVSPGEAAKAGSLGQDAIRREQGASRKFVDAFLSHVR